MMTANAGAVIVAAMAAARRRVLNTLRGANATAPDRARAIEGLDRMARKQLERLVADGVIRQASPGHYYLDEPALAVWEREQRRKALIAIVVILFLALVAVVSLRS